MNVLKMIFLAPYMIWAVFWFVLYMLLIFPFVILFSFFGKIKGGNMIYKLLHSWGDFWFFMIGIRVRKIYEHTPDHAKQYVFVVNHISNLDAAMLVKVVRQPFRPLGKIELKNVPVFGFIYKTVVVVVDRSNAEHRQRSIRQLKSVMKKGISILIFPEGTFNETHKPMKHCFDGAFRLAIETQTPIKPIIFPDTYSRMHYRSAFTLNPGICRAVFLAPVPVEGMTLEDVPLLKQQVISLMEAKLREYKAEWIRDEAQ
jgi:1-acyl-sn-glycerol-3-phosphate acyltransferase